MAVSGNGGAKPFLDKDGKPLGPVIESSMVDKGMAPTLREQLAMGVGKAHRSVTFSHYDYRNYERSYLGTTGKVQ